MFGAMYYRHSGRFSASRLAMLVPVGLAFGALLGFAYGYLFAYLPIVGYVSFILAAGFGLLLGVGIVFLTGIAHVRSTPIAVLVTLLVTGFAYYTSWIAWVHAIAGRADVALPLGELATSPGMLWSFISVINENGVMSISGWVPKGMVLWAFWSLEVVLIFVPALLTVKGVGRDTVYCEPCKAWCKLAPTIDLEDADLDDIGQRLEAGDVQALTTLPPRNTEAPVWTRVEVMRCGCEQTNTLSVKKVWIEADDEGARTEKEAVVVNRLIIDRPTAEQLTRGPT
jgi:hypothetical protein